MESIVAECWSCGAERGESEFCGSCELIQPPSPKVDHFGALGLPRRMALDRSSLDRSFRERSKRVHPDLFGARSPIERRLALEHTVRLNEAHRTLSRPMSRGIYLLELEGVGGASETDRTTDGDFLMQMLELQEEVDRTTEVSRLEALRDRLGSRGRQLFESLEDFFDRGQGSIDSAKDALDELRYLARLEERIELKLEETES